MGGKQPQSVEDQITNLRRWNRTLVKSVQNLALDVQALTKEVNRHTKVVDTLNGSVDSIHQIAEIAPTLVRLSQQLNPDIVVEVVALASKQRERDDWWAGTRHRLSPLKPIGAAFWLVASGLLIWVVGSVIVNYIGPAVHHG